MAATWTILAGKYRFLKNHNLLASAKCLSLIHRNCFRAQKQHCNGDIAITNHQAVTNPNLTKRPLKLCYYPSKTWIKSSHRNLRYNSSYGTTTKCQKCIDGFPLVKQNTHFHTSSNNKSTRLTPVEASNILRKNEYTTDDLWTGPEAGNCPVKAFDMNSIRSNNPTEDAHSEAIIRVGTTSPNGMLFGIFDGHGGAACGQVK